MINIARTFALLAALGLAGCTDAGADTKASPAVPGHPTPTTATTPDARLKTAAVADFAAGCFWGSEGTFRKVKGVIATEVGYEGGPHAPTPPMRTCATHTTGHAETVRVFYDPAKVSYQQLVDDVLREPRPDHGGPAGTR